MRDNLTIIKELIVPLNLSQLIDLKNTIDVLIINSIITKLTEFQKLVDDGKKPNIPATKEVPQNIPPEAEPQKTVWKASGEKAAGRDANRGEEGWTYADKDIELSNYLADSGGSAKVDLDGVEFNVKFSGTDNRFLSRSLPKNK